MNHSRLSISAFHGNRDLLDRSKLALFCSSKCPGKLILDAYELCKGFCGRQQTVISGFHSPVEKECLNILLSSECPIIVCPSRGVKVFRIPKEWRKPIDDGRLVVVSPFPSSIRRNTRKLADKRNEFVAGLATKILIVHAAAGSKLLDLATKLVADGKPVYTVACEENDPLLRLGAKAYAS